MLGKIINSNDFCQYLIIFLTLSEIQTYFSVFFRFNAILESKKAPICSKHTFLLTCYTKKKTNFGFVYVFLIGSTYKQNINFNQSTKQCLSTSKKYAFLLNVISLWIKVDFAISWRKVKIWLTSTNVKYWILPKWLSQSELLLWWN